MMAYSTIAAHLKGSLYAFLEPPPVLRLSEWAEEHIVLPEGSRARPGAYRTGPTWSRSSTRWRIRLSSGSRS